MTHEFIRWTWGIVTLVLAARGGISVRDMPEYGWCVWWWVLAFCATLVGANV